MAEFVRWFSELRMGDAASVGGKCAALGELTRAGVRVPAGFALNVAAYKAFRALGALPTAVRAELAEAYRRLAADKHGPDTPVAVRSSALGEDSAEASFAGQQETFLWRRGLDDVATHVVRCWESLYSAEAVAYRAHLGRTTEPLMSVAIQKMVDARVAGVLFTLSPATGDRSVIAINASWGLGLGVVGGEVTPDEYWVDKVSLTIRRRTIVDKAVEFRPDQAAGGVMEVAVPAERRMGPCLNDAEVLALAQMGKQVEQHFATPQDIEWAFEGDDLHVLQSRPETVWSRKRATDSRRPTVASPLDYVLRAMGGRGVAK